MNAKERLEGFKTLKEDFKPKLYARKDRFGNLVTLKGRAQAIAEEQWKGTCAYVCMNVCMYVRTYVRTYVRMYVCIYVRLKCSQEQLAVNLQAKFRCPSM